MFMWHGQQLVCRYTIRDFHFFKVFLQYLVLTVQAHTVYVTWGSPGNVAALHYWQWVWPPQSKWCRGEHWKQMSQRGPLDGPQLAAEQHQQGWGYIKSGETYYWRQFCKQLMANLVSFLVNPSGHACDLQTHTLLLQEHWVEGMKGNQCPVVCHAAAWRHPAEQLPHARQRFSVSLPQWPHVPSEPDQDQWLE